MMAPLKRPAASQYTTPFKKHASSVKHDAVHDGLMQSIRDAISNSSAPPVVKDMLIISMEYSLGIQKDSRHRFQEEVVEMIASTLGDEEKKMAQEFEDAKGAVEKCDTEAASQAEAVDAAKAAASDKTQALAITQVDLATAEHAVEDQLQACNEIEHELNAIKDEVNGVLQKQGKLNAVVAEVVKPAKDGEGISKDVVDSFLELCTALACDTSMVQAIPSAFEKAAENRGDFDKIVIEHVEKVIVDKLAAQQADVNKSETEMSAREAKLESAKAELQQRIQNKESLESKVAQADTAKKRADSDVLHHSRH